MDKQIILNNAASDSVEIHFLLVLRFKIYILKLFANPQLEEAVRLLFSSLILVSFFLKLSR